MAVSTTLRAFQFQPKLQGETIKLEPLTSQLFVSLQECARDLGTWTDYPTASVRNTGDLSSWFARGAETENAMVVSDIATNNVIGTTRYYAVPDDPNGIGIGYTFLAADFRRSGKTNAELKRLMFSHAFETFNAVWFHVLPLNMRSQAAVRKLGVEEIGLQTLHLTDQPREFVCFRLNGSSWQELS